MTCVFSASTLSVYQILHLLVQQVPFLMVRSPYKSSLVRPVRISGVNWIGVKTLYLKEGHRFLNVPTQTLLGPVVTAVLFMMIFSVVVGERVGLGLGTNFIQFLAPERLLAWNSYVAFFMWQLLFCSCIGFLTDATG